MGFLGFFETIFAKLAHVFQEIEKDEPQIEKAAALTIGLMAPLLEEVVGLTAGAANAELVTGVIDVIQKDMADVQAILVAAGPAPTAKTLLDAIVANLNSLLADAGIKDGETLSKTETVVKTIVGEIEAIIKAL